MSPHSAAPQQNLKRTLWLAVLVGWLAQLGLSLLLPVIGEVAGRSFAMATGSSDSWAEHTQNASHFGWQVVQFLVFFASLAAGALAAYLTPRKPWVVAAVLVVLSLASSVFQQLPSPRSPGILLTWILAPCIGVVFGVALSWFLRHRGA